VDAAYPDAIRDALQIIGTGGGRAAALHLIAWRDRAVFLADTSIHIDPGPQELADIAIAAADAARTFDVEPRVAFLSFSNFGSVAHTSARRSAQAARLLTAARPALVVDGEMHVDVALSPDVARRFFPHSRIQGDANVLVCPDLASANIGYKLLEHLAGGESVGPILLGLRKPVVVSYQAASAQTLVHLASIALARAGAQA
jgi:malate dehydrogenase (oxaloacetate-decarboxylating)(NADP+)